MRTVIHNATIVNERHKFTGSVVIEDELITQVVKGQFTDIHPDDLVVDAKGKYLIPGVIDDHVHFRQPGLERKGDIETESCAAAAGGVTSYMDMPNTHPETDSVKRLNEKYKMAETKSHVNYAFFFGAHKKNIKELSKLNPQQVCGVKVYMDDDSLGKKQDKQDRVLREIMEKSPVMVMVHCQDRNTIRQNLKKLKKTFPGQNDYPVRYHSRICDVNAGYNAVLRAVNIAQETGARLHLAQISSNKELSLLASRPLEEKRITAEACIANLMFCTEDYDWLGTRIKTDPALKSFDDRAYLRAALSLGLIDVVSSDHAPHLLEEKVGGALRAASGIPCVQLSLVSMLELADKDILTVGKVVELMCHNPALLYKVERRGFIREGYYADLVLLNPESYWKVREQHNFSKCGWTPMDEHTFKWKVERTWVNGEIVYRDGEITEHVKGKALMFR